MVGHPKKERERTRLSGRLSIRERQVHLAARGFKEVLRFKSAHQSVFATEVQQLQRVALKALVEMAEVETGKPGRAQMVLSKGQRLIDRKAVLESARLRGLMLGGTELVGQDSD